MLEAIGEGQHGVLAERTNYALLRTTFKNTHLNPIAVNMDEDGMLPDALDQQVKAQAAVSVSGAYPAKPDHSYHERQAT